MSIGRGDVYPVYSVRSLPVTASTGYFLHQYIETYESNAKITSSIQTYIKHK